MARSQLSLRRAMTIWGERNASSIPSVSIISMCTTEGSRAGNLFRCADFVSAERGADSKFQSEGLRAGSYFDVASVIARHGRDRLAYAAFAASAQSDTSVSGSTQP